MTGSNPAKGHYKTPDYPNAKRLTSNINLSFDGCRVCPSVQANALTKDASQKSIHQDQFLSRPFHGTHQGKSFYPSPPMVYLPEAHPSAQL